MQLCSSVSAKNARIHWPVILAFLTSLYVEFASTIVATLIRCWFITCYELIDGSAFRKRVRSPYSTRYSKDILLIPISKRRRIFKEYYCNIIIPFNILLSLPDNITGFTIITWVRIDTLTFAFSLDNYFNVKIHPISCLFLINRYFLLK